MATINVRVRYRPVRIGWCVRNNNWDDLRRALRVTHILWGGKFNPVIPVGAPGAEELVSSFRVDVLLDVVEDNEIKAFTEKFKYLPWPLLERAAFGNSAGRLAPNFLDISRVITKLADELRVPRSLASAEDPFVGFPGSNPYALVHWDKDDPLADVLLITFGAYPEDMDIYEEFLRTNIRPHEYRAESSQPVPAYLLEQDTPSSITTSQLNWDRVPYSPTMGFYAGTASDFDDIVNYWNLRAADLNVLFLDPDHLSRMELLRNSHLDFISQRLKAGGKQHRIEVWSRSQEAVRRLNFSEALVPVYNAVEGARVIGGSLRPPLHYWSQRAVMGSLSERYGSVMAAFQLPDKPFAVEDDWTVEHFVVSVSNPAGAEDGPDTFWTPYIPPLNQWYGRNRFLERDSVRAELEGIGVICPITTENLELAATRKQELAKKFLELAGIDAQPSLPGRMASRLISQLGGLQGCRVLKIAGVRRLIRKYGPLQDFDRTEAIRTIGDSDPVTGQPRFSDYEGLFIEQRDPSITKLKPEHAFHYLLDKGVFRVGLQLVCPGCELPSWVALDDVSTRVTCELCGRRFNITRQLKDRAWSYRRSGLFGRENNQEGSIPVALTLQQLDTAANRSSGHSIFLTNQSLMAAGADIQPCETDIFVAISQFGRIQIAIGECKDAGGQIELDDARKMAAVADSFPKDQFEVYIVFSKTAPFTTEDIESCRAAQRKNARLRVIMLSDRELEPYFIYERTAQQFSISPSASSFEEMAHITQEVFFEPKRKV